MTAIADDAKLHRARELMEAPLERDLVGLHVDTGLCYGFNETAAAVWRHLAQPATFADLIVRMREEFDVPAGECREEVARLIRSLADEGLITVTAAR